MAMNRRRRMHCMEKNKTKFILKKKKDKREEEPSEEMHGALRDSSPSAGAARSAWAVAKEVDECLPADFAPPARTHSHTETERETDKHCVANETEALSAVDKVPSVRDDSCCGMYSLQIFFVMFASVLQLRSNRAADP